MSQFDATTTCPANLNLPAILPLLRPMMGFKAFHSATAAIAGIEVAHMIRKRQFEANDLSAFQQFAVLAA